MSVANYFYLGAGLLALFFGIGHAAWGQHYILGDVRSSSMPASTRHMLLVIWNQPTVFHLLSAVTLIAASTTLLTGASGPLAAFIGLVTLGFLLNFVVTSLVRDRAALRQVVPQALMVTVYLGILAAGVSVGVAG